MRDSIGLVGIFQIVILFILLFTGIMALTINNSNAFGVKDEILTVIDFNNGEFIDDEGNLDAEIVEAMEYNSYRNTGRCPEGWTGFDRNGTETDGEASVCVQCVNISKSVDKYYSKLGGNVATESNDEYSIVDYYYRVQVFYQLDIPVLEQAFNFKTNGESKLIYGKNALIPEMCKQ